MGYNTTIVVMNDALDQIAKDPNFGKNLVAAIEMAKQFPDKRQDVAAGNHVNAAHVVETHHADTTVLVSVGGNLGLVQARSRGWNHHEVTFQVELLRVWAQRLGMRVVNA